MGPTRRCLLRGHRATPFTRVGSSHLQTPRVTREAPPICRHLGSPARLLPSARSLASTDLGGASSGVAGAVVGSNYARSHVAGAMVGSTVPKERRFESP